MSSLADVDDVARLSDAELDTLLARLESEEREVSKRRSRLHDQIGFVQAGAYAAAELADEHLTSLRASEHELSARRRLLHREIDELRAERSRRRTSP